MKKNKTENHEGHYVIKQLNVLPLLPANKIEEGVTIILTHVNVTFKNDKSKLKKWRQIINAYFKLEWMKKIGPQVFSIFKAVD